MKNFLFATAVLMSTIVGVGVFTLPYAAAQSGFMIGAVFLFILTGIILLLHLMYGEIVSRTKEKHRLTGYAAQYLGKWGRGVVALSTIVAFYGSLLVYIIVGGGFLANTFSFLNVSPIIFNLIFFSIGVIAIYFGLRLIAELDLLMGLFLIIIIFLFLYFSLSKVDFVNFTTINWSNIFVPYGVILYSLAGLSAIPEIKELFLKEKRSYKRAIIWGTLIPAVLYFIFIWTVVGLTGLNTTAEAVQGLTNVLGEKIVFLGSLFGFLACLTSFFIIGLSLKKTFWYDFKINKNLSWLLVCFIPLVLFLFGVREFIPIIAFIGALSGAVSGTAVVLIYKKAKKLGNQFPEYSLKIPDLLRCFLIIVFILGFILTLISMV